MHTPVFREKVLTALNVKEGGTYIDATYGEGGHSKAIVAQGGRVLALELDPTQVAKMKDVHDEKLQVVCANFANIEGIAKAREFYPVDGILFDFGLSMEQLKHGERGFSYQFPHQPLDMRIGIGNRQKKGATKAADVMTEYSVSELVSMLEANAEVANAKAIAMAIVTYRRKKNIVLVGDLLNALAPLSLTKSQVAQIFQALRIEVNSEFASIRDGLRGATDLIAKKGKIAIISFHSLEDRIVKLWAKEAKMRETMKHVGRHDREAMSFEKSAVLRVYEPI